MKLNDIPLYNVVSFGNSKLPNSTMIFNIGSATNSCPNMGTERCQVPAKQCYARVTEQRWNNVLEYRERQREYWETVKPNNFVQNFNKIRSRKRNIIKAIRFNVSSDIRNRSDIVRIEQIARSLNVPVYLYTASSHVNFELIDNVIIQCSNTELFNKYGNKDNFGTFRVVDSFDNILPKYSNYYKCFGNCSNCSHCLKARNVIVERH